MVKDFFFLHGSYLYIDHWTRSMKMQLEYLNDDGIDILCCKTLSWTHNYVEFFVAVYLLFCDDG